MVDGTELVACKRAGKLSNLAEALEELARTGNDRGLTTGRTGIGHTRWATHGGPTDRNAHPHMSGDGRIAVIHNGIIENFAKLRAELEAAGVELVSDTDSECVAHLLAGELAALSPPSWGAEEELPSTQTRTEAAFSDPGERLAEAMRRVCLRLEGAFTLLAVDSQAPGVVVGARRDSPLVVGRGDGEHYLASDVAAFIAHTRQAVELGQDQVPITRLLSITDFYGRPGRGPRFLHRLGRHRRGEGRLRLLHAQGDRGAAAGGRRHLRGRFTANGKILLDEVRLADQTCGRTRCHRHRDGVPRRHGR